MVRPFLRSLLLVCLSAVAIAAADGRRPLNHDDYDSWRTIGAPVIARDGQWLAYSFMPLEGDGDVIARSLIRSTEFRVPVGALPPPPLTASEENPERPAPRREVTIAITSDSRFLIATAFPAQAETLQAKRDKKKPEEMPKDGLVIVDLSNGTVTRIASVKSFQVPAKGGGWVAYLKEPPPETKDEAPKPEPTTAAAAAETGSEKKSPADPEKQKKRKDQKYGSDLVLRQLYAPTEKAERVFPNVLDYSFARDGRMLVFTVASRTETENGVYAVTPGDSATPIALVSGPGRYVKFTWDREQTQAVFASDRAEPEAKAPRFALYHWKRGTAAATEIVPVGTAGLPEGYAVSGDAAAAFSFDGTKIHVPAAPFPKEPDARLAELLDQDKVSLDLWHWRDDYIQPMQKVRADQERKRTYLGVFDLASHRYVQLADPALANVVLNDDATRGFGRDDRAYRRRETYDRAYHDLYLVDAATGQRQLVYRELGEKSGERWSHTGRWLAFFHEKQWHVIDAQSGTIRPLSANIPFALYDELVDVPEPAGSCGTAGWTRDGESLLIYDRYDVWQVFPDGRPARNLTRGFGRANRIQLRVQNTEASEPGDDKRGIDASRPLILRGESEVTRSSGFFRTSFAANVAPEQLLWRDQNVRYLGRALEADRVILSGSRFDLYPDLLATNTSFTAPAKVTDGGAQLAPFLWGSTELLTYRNADGVELPAALFKPANFDPNKKYPLIVYLYERLSQVVHTFTPPLPGTVVNPPFYTSNGYLILMPDIAYTVGYPGQSALKCVLPAIDGLVRRGFVDENAIGIQGHSWGGYQIAYMVTQTNRFRAAEAGAVVGNMTSAYSGIRWGSGRPRQYQYEQAQSRIGRSLQDAPLLYLENSPVFFAHRVTTPLLLLHNDQDDAVPWYQGIEFFLALRRHDKEAYLFNYNNEFHGLRRRADQKDFARRMSQFFDHFLKGAPRPEWMDRGVPYLERDEEKLRFRDSN
ncbi:S9 family peptidase [Opitutus terrae]|uniref:Peptidase S9 prolyl oligopeptidase active site domain protein n=1 Tax=Opitutus terrae (strain DSM 11246 / JCM 15787 / PB90-1) TaxID=452637 RepID=B1ZY30_OPITP|nr:prolyl oligopeptidase family serine peptidase [Opitutus terrae]ACB76179.1 peptidase S9 prolyl oligopeptidase active site domain protein [Opitutus terrae PB90-1]